MLHFLYGDITDYGGMGMKRYIAIMALSLNVSFSMTCSASAQSENEIVYSAEMEMNMEQRTNSNSRATDKIEIKYRLYKGVIQYRRWNATKNRWVDSEWKNL